MSRLAIVALLAALTALTAATARPIIPACPEDAMLVGTGQFADGRWDAYVCGPAVDDVR